MTPKSRVSLAGIVLVAAAVGAQASDTKEFHRTSPLDRDGRLSVKTYKGSIDVSVWDKPEVQIDARIEPGDDERCSREKVQWTEVRVSGSGKSVSVESDYDEANAHQRRHFFGLFDFDSCSLPYVRYTIRMPASARLDIEDYKSDSKIAGLRSDLRFHTYKGTAAVADHDGAVRADTYKGTVRVDYARYERASRFETYKGDIEVGLPRASRFELDAETDRGDIQSDFALTRWSGRRRGERVRGPVNGGGPALSFESRRGSLRLRSR